MEASYAGLTYEEAVRKYARTVAGVCFARLQNQADVEDCFQNTFVKLLTKSPKFRDEEHLRRWLVKVAANECVSLRRKRKNDLSLDDIGDLPDFRSDDENDISWALMELKPDYREILYLYYAERFRVNEIAEILGKNPNTVKVMLKRGRDKLKKIYGGDGS